LRLSALGGIHVTDEQRLEGNQHKKNQTPSHYFSHWSFLPMAAGM
jgi:hypothetical protein